jgi:hypothetical protein
MNTSSNDVCWKKDRILIGTQIKTKIISETANANMNELVTVFDFLIIITTSRLNEIAKNNINE